MPRGAIATEGKRGEDRASVEPSQGAQSCDADFRLTASRAGRQPMPAV